MDTLEVLGSVSRWKILEALRAGPADGSSLASMLGISVQGVMKHINILLNAGLVERTQIDGRFEYRLKGKLWLRHEAEQDYEIIFFLHSASENAEKEFKVRRHIKRLLRYLYLSYG
ncbi:MAG: helix-turn-helix domain-containing protein [Conexivisphaerales archaeon]